MSNHYMTQVSKQHDRKKFDCGEEPLNTFLQNSARQHLDKGISRTEVLCDPQDPDAIIGFTTLTLCSIVPHKDGQAASYPNELSALKLARMAVDLKHQGRGVGKYLLLDVLKKAWQIQQYSPLQGVVVDAKNDSVVNFYKSFGFVVIDDAEDKYALMLTMANIEELMTPPPK